MLLLPVPRKTFTSALPFASVVAVDAPRPRVTAVELLPSLKVAAAVVSFVRVTASKPVKRSGLPRSKVPLPERASVSNPAPPSRESDGLNVRAVA